VAVAALLLSLNLASSWRWPIKVVGILVVSALYIGTYLGAEGLPGWPSKSALPDYFRLHWAIVTEPDKLTGESGNILVWTEALDDEDHSLNPPRAFELTYDDELAQRIERALGLISEGQAITGSFKAAETGEETDEEGTAGEEEIGAGQGGNDSIRGVGQPPELFFEQMKPPPQPAKRLL